MIAAILLGDTTLYHELIRPHERRVYIMALSYMKNKEDAEDVAQETFVRALHNLDTFRRDSNFGSWLISIALSESRNRLRRRATARTAPLDEAQGEEMPVSPALLRNWRELPSEVVEHDKIRKLLDQAVNMLPDIYQQVFLLRDVEGLDLNDTAGVLNISTSLVKFRLHRARLILQSLLAPQLTEHHRCLEENVGAENGNTNLFERQVMNRSNCI